MLIPPGLGGKWGKAGDNDKGNGDHSGKRVQGPSRDRKRGIGDIKRDVNGSM